MTDQKLEEFNQLMNEPSIDDKKKDSLETKNQGTKLYHALRSKGWSRTDLFNAIQRLYPDESVSMNAISLIVSGKRLYYSTKTLIRICDAMKMTPNEILDWEQGLCEEE